MAIYVAFYVPDVHDDIPPVMHCSHMGPHLRDPVPMGTFFSFWVPISVRRSPFSLFRALGTREKSMQPLHNVNHVITCNTTTSTCESHASSGKEQFFPPYKGFKFIELACFDQFCKHALFGSPFCWRGSPFGPHFTKNWNPILKKGGSP